MKSDQEVLIQLEEEISTYKFYFVLMSLTGVNNCESNTKNLQAENLINRPIKTIMNDLHNHKKILISEKEKSVDPFLDFSQISMAISRDYTSCTETPITERVSRQGSICSFPSKNEDFGKELNQILKLGKFDIKKIREKLSNTVDIDCKNLENVQNDLQKSRLHIEFLKEMLNKYQKSTISTEDITSIDVDVSEIDQLSYEE